MPRRNEEKPPENPEGSPPEKTDEEKVNEVAEIGAPLMSKLLFACVKEFACRHGASPEVGIHPVNYAPESDYRKFLESLPDPEEI